MAKKSGRIKADGDNRIEPEGDRGIELSEESSPITGLGR